MLLWKIISTLHKDHLEKLTVMSLLLDTALPIARPIIKLTVKLKRKYNKNKSGKFAKRAKKAGLWSFEPYKRCFIFV